MSKYVEARPLPQTMTEHFKRQEERASKRAGGEEDYDEGKHHKSTTNANVVFALPVFYNSRFLLFRLDALSVADPGC